MALGIALPFALPFISFGKSILHHSAKLRKGFFRFGRHKQIPLPTLSPDADRNVFRWEQIRQEIIVFLMISITNSLKNRLFHDIVLR